MINSKNKKFVIQLVVQVWEEYVCVSGRSVAVTHPMYRQLVTVRCRYTGCRYCVISSWAMDLLFVVTYPIPTNKILIIHSIYEKIAKLGRISSFEVHLLSTGDNNEDLVRREDNSEFISIGFFIPRWHSQVYSCGYEITFMGACFLCRGYTTAETRIKSYNGG